MLFGMGLFAGGDAIAKFLTETLHPVQIIWFRQIGLFLGAMILVCLRGPALLKSSQPALQISRGMLVVMSSLCFVFAIRYVALADAVATSFVAPFFVMILGAVFLKEPVRTVQWIAVIIGFLGAVIVVRPGTGAVHPAALLVVAAAFFFAARQIIGRLIADTDSTATTISYTAIVATLILSMPLTWFWVWPASVFEWTLLLSLAIVASGGEVLLIKALETAEAASIAPVHYSLLLWGTFYGFWIFGDLPDIWTWSGSAIIIAAGIYTLRK